MSAEQGWSESKKWAMGLVSATIMLTLGAGIQYFIKREAPPAQAAPPSSARCDTVRGYPLGRWHVRGVQVRNGKKDTSFSREIYFDQDMSGTWPEGLGKALPDGSYPMEPDAPFTASQKPAAGAKLVLSFRRKEKFTPEEEAVASDLDRKYKQDEVEFVSVDGCSMRGHSLQDEQGGNLTVLVDYCWDSAPSCPPLPESEGWRPPVLAQNRKQKRP